MPRTRSQATPDVASTENAQDGAQEPPAMHVEEQRKRRNVSQLIKNTYYVIWSIVGLVVITLLALAVFGSDSWSENLNLTSAAPAAEEQQQPQQTPAPQQPAQPTEEQLNCVRDEVGEERFSELEQGGTATEEESGIIQECLQG